MIVMLILFLSLGVSALLLARTLWALSRYKYRPSDKKSILYSPSVSVCIAARNEMHVLSVCLENVLKSDYEKLEVIVLDDSSQDDTPHIIRSFAHAGVRFVAGRPVPDGWLGKNHAYQTLSEEASGDLLLFLDVDAKLSSSAISNLVAELNASERSMVSVLPRREDATRVSAIFGSLRYFWSLVLATKKTPPSASTVWLIDRKKLLELEKGLDDYGWSVRPESHIARQLQIDKDYYYLIGTRELGVAFEKRWHSQVETASRLYYPISGRGYLTGLSVLSLSLLIAPFGLLWFLEGVSLIIAIISIMLSLTSFAVFTAKTSASKGWMQRALLVPCLLVQELLLLLLSAYRYLTRTVTWKGRPVQRRS
jgi:glycosyltransferase involved in cell wall biosynthesis